MVLKLAALILLPSLALTPITAISQNQYSNANSIYGISNDNVEPSQNSARSIWTDSNPFDEYLTGKPPKIVKELKTEVLGDITLRYVVFYSRSVRTITGPVRTEVYAIIARPAKSGLYPGILLLHGGAGSAQHDLAIYWAKHGYITVTPDLPGLADPKSAPNSSGLWKSAKYSTNHFRVVPDATASDIFEATVAALQAFYLLQSQPDVNLAKIGVTGVSWGGYETIMVSALTGKDVKAAFAIYGSGHYDLGSSFKEDLDKLPKEQEDAWLTILDAKNYAPKISADFFEASATNDNFFWPPAVAATLDDIHSHKNLALAPNSNHWMNIPGGTERTKPGVPHSNGWMYMQPVYFDYLLKGEGQPFPEVDQVSTGSAERGIVSVRFHVKGCIGAVTPKVFYSKNAVSWKKRDWLEVDAKREGKWYEAHIPAGSDWFGSVTDSRIVTVTSRIQSHVSKTLE